MAAAADYVAPVATDGTERTVATGLSVEVPAVGGTAKGDQAESTPCPLKTCGSKVVWAAVLAVAVVAVARARVAAPAAVAAVAAVVAVVAVPPR